MSPVVASLIAFIVLIAGASGVHLVENAVAGARGRRAESR